MSFQQLPLFSDETITTGVFPSTRYQGSKRKLLDWIWINTRDLHFDSVLDVFAGTGAVSHLYKRAGKRVIYNDVLQFNWNIGLALIENSTTKLSPEDVDIVLRPHPDAKYPTFIQNTFSGIYFTDEENAWLDRVIYNISSFLNHPYKQALARFALFQACIIKRPYNLFHRANLYMRTADVERSFGNKKTWDTSFEAHFRAFVNEANQAVFDNQQQNRSLNLDAFETPVGADLVYLDPPYISKNGLGVDYRDFYHFLEGIMNYESWSRNIDYDSRHRRLVPIPSIWNKAEESLNAFEKLVQRHQNSALVISYRDDGIPNKEQLIDLLHTYKKEVREAQLPQKYALAHRQMHELLLIAV
jgi:adenine-specific DNA methylase